MIFIFELILNLLKLCCNCQRSNGDIGSIRDKFAWRQTFQNQVLVQIGVEYFFDGEVGRGEKIEQQ